MNQDAIDELRAFADAEVLRQQRENEAQKALNGKGHYWCSRVPPSGMHGDFKIIRGVRRSDEAEANSAHAEGSQTAPELRWAIDAEVPTRSDYVVKHLMELGQIVVMYGPTGCGKSFGASHIGYGVARRAKIFGRRVIQSGCVFYFGSEGMVVKRLAAYNLHHGKPKDGLRTPFFYETRRFNLQNERDFTAMVKLVKAAIAASGEECVLAIVDTMARCFPGLDLDVPANMSIVARRLEELRDAIGRPCVACVHHTGHPGSTDRKIKLRGGYQLACDVDAVLGFNRDETTRITTISIDKERDLEDGARLAFSLLQKNLGTDQDNEPITSCVVIEEDVPLPAAGKPKKPRTAAEHFADLVKDAMAVCGGKHQIGNKRNGAWITAAVRHDSDDFREYLFSRGFINRDENPGTISSRISRGRRVALEKGLICADETHVWVM